MLHAGQLGRKRRGSEIARGCGSGTVHRSPDGSSPWSYGQETDPAGQPDIRILHEGTNHVVVNEAIRVRDAGLFPGAPDMK